MIRLRALRQEQNISMRQLGDIFGMAESKISLYENEKRKIVKFGEKIFTP